MKGGANRTICIFAFFLSVIIATGTKAASLVDRVTQSYLRSAGAPPEAGPGYENLERRLKVLMTYGDRRLPRSARRRFPPLSSATADTLARETAPLISMGMKESDAVDIAHRVARKNAPRRITSSASSLASIVVADLLARKMMSPERTWNALLAETESEMMGRGAADYWGKQVTLTAGISATEFQVRRHLLDGAGWSFARRGAFFLLLTGAIYELFNDGSAFRRWQERGISTRQLAEEIALDFSEENVSSLYALIGSSVAYATVAPMISSLVDRASSAAIRRSYDAARVQAFTSAFSEAREVAATAARWSRAAAALRPLALGGTLIATWAIEDIVRNVLERIGTPSAHTWEALSLEGTELPAQKERALKEVERASTCGSTLTMRWRAGRSLRELHEMADHYRSTVHRATESAREPLLQSLAPSWLEHANNVVKDYDTEAWTLATRLNQTCRRQP